MYQLCVRLYFIDGEILVYRPRVSRGRSYNRSNLSSRLPLSFSVSFARDTSVRFASLRVSSRSSLYLRWGRLLERVAITISGHYDRMDSVQRVAATPMEPTVYHCGPTLAKRCTSILSVPLTTYRPPDSLSLFFLPRSSAPLLRSLRNYKHSFRTKSSRCWRSLTVRNESRANRIFAIDCHPFAFVSLSLVHRSFHTMVRCSPFPNFRDYRPPRLIAARIYRRECSKPKEGFYSLWKKWNKAYQYVTAKIVAGLVAFLNNNVVILVLLSYNFMQTSL